MLTKKLRVKQFFVIGVFIFTTNLFAETGNLAIEIDNPKFSEKGLNDKIYEIKAKKGLKSENELELFLIEGKFKNEKNGKWIYLEAEKGNFSQTRSQIELKNNIVFYTDDGEKFRSTKAIFNMNNDIIELKEDVSHESVRGLIISDTSVISENFNKIVYNGNVKTIIKDTD